MPRKLFPNKTNICKQRKVTPPRNEILCSWPGCQREFVSSENLEEHLKAHRKGLHECIYCKRQFQYKSHLNSHTRIHTGEKPYKCSLCPKSSSTLGNLQLHTRIHTGEQPYKVLQFCEICAKSFATVSSLVVHQRIHNGDKPYKCTICSKSFSQRGHLQAHVRIHTGERPYTCKICPKSFAHKPTLQYHMRTHRDKVARARSIGRKCNISNGNLHMRKVGKREEENKPNNCKQRPKRRSEDVGRHNEGVAMGGATIRRMETKYKQKTERLSLLTCQVCHLIISSLDNLCRHYSLEHNLPKVVLHNLTI